MGRYSRKWAWTFRSWDCKIFFISRMNQWIELTFYMLIPIQEIWKLLQKFLSGRGQNWAWPFRSRNSKICIPKWIDELSWFFTYWHKVRKAKNYFNNYWVGMIKNEHCLNDEINWADFLHADTNSGKLKVSLIITRLIVINIAPLTELFCNCLLADMKLPTVKRHKFQCKVLVWCD